MARVATVTCCPEIEPLVKAVMAKHFADLQDIKTYIDHVQMQFALMPGCDVDQLNSDLDRNVGAHNYRGRVSG